jgi:hypothetical protein
LDARGEHDDHDEQAQGVGDDEPLPAVDLLAGVVTTAVASDGVRALDALRTTYKIPSTMDLRGRFSSRPPVLGAGSSGSTSAHCSSVKSEGFN